MHIFWGILMILAGLFLLICGTIKSEFVIYRLLFSRSKILWGEKAYRFHQVSGIIIMLFGVLVAIGIF